MKKIIALGVAMLLTGTAWAATPKTNKITCDVKGVQKMVKSAEACKLLGGTVVTPDIAKKL